MIYRIEHNVLMESLFWEKSHLQIEAGLEYTLYHLSHGTVVYVESGEQVFRVKKLMGRRGAPELELLAVVIVLFAPILHESLTNSNFAMLFINITVFKDICKRVSFVG